MPLLVNNKLGCKTALKDIRCYKLFKKSNTPNVFESIYSNSEENYVIGNTYNTGNEVFTTKKLVSEGYFHFWKNKEDAIEVFSVNIFLGNMKESEISLLECIIPKGTDYYEGLAGCYQSLASPKMRLNKVVPIKPFKVDFRNPSERELIDYWNNIVKKTLPVNKQVFDEKRKSITKALWQIEDFHNRRKGYDT